MQRYLTPETQIEVAGQIATRDVRAEIDAQFDHLRARTVQRVNVVEVSEDAYLVLYLQMRDMLETMGYRIPSDIREYRGLRVRRVSGHGVIQVLAETEEANIK